MNFPKNVINISNKTGMDINADETIIQMMGNTVADNRGILPDLTKFARSKYMDKLAENPDYVPDKYSTRQLFLINFLSSGHMDEVVGLGGLFMREHLKDLDEYRLDYFGNANDCFLGLDAYHVATNWIYHGALQGEARYADFFRDKYKKNFGKEYKILKKFSCVNLGDVAEIPEDSEENLLVSGSRVLCMAELMGIRIDSSCSIFYEWVTDVMSQRDEHGELSYPGLYEADYFSDAEKIDKYENEALNFLDENHRFYKDVCKQVKFSNMFSNTMLFSDVVNADADVTYDYFEEFIRVFGSVFYIFDVKHREKSYDNLLHSTALALSMHLLITAYQTVADDYKDLLGLGAVDYFVEKVEGCEDEEKPSAEKTPVHHNNQSESPLEEQVRKLQEQLHIKDQQIKNLHAMYTEEKGRAASMSVRIEKASQEHSELVSLREFAYNSTEKDLDDAPKIDQQSMINAVKDMKIAIVGGHPNWINKMKQVFPDFKYFRPDVQATIADSALGSTEKVYFFTDTLSHSEYYKLLNLVQAKGLPFGYIHTVNMANVIKQLYEEK